MPPNEDIVGAAGNLAWAIDGATPLSPVRTLPGSSDARFFVECVDRQLAVLGDRGLSDIRKVLDLLIEHILCQLEQVRLAEWTVPPAASIALALLEDSFISVATLGDAAAIMCNDNKVITLFDSRFLAKEVSAVGTTVGDDASSNTFRQSAMLERRCGYIAGDGDMWVLSVNPFAATGATVVSMPRSARVNLVLATDGFTRCVSPYHILPSWESILSEVSTSSCGAIAKKVRNYEAELAEPMPLFKKRDDLAAIHVRCD